MLRDECDKDSMNVVGMLETEERERSGVEARERLRCRSWKIGDYNHHCERARKGELVTTITFVSEREMQGTNPRCMKHGMWCMTTGAKCALHRNRQRSDKYRGRREGKWMRRKGVVERAEL
jgi:hypothetical protein